MDLGLCFWSICMVIIRFKVHQAQPKVRYIQVKSSYLGFIWSLTFHRFLSTPHQTLTETKASTHEVTPPSGSLNGSGWPESWPESWPVGGNWRQPVVVSNQTPNMEDKEDLDQENSPTHLESPRNNPCSSLSVFRRPGATPNSLPSTFLISSGEQQWVSDLLPSICRLSLSLSFVSLSLSRSELLRDLEHIHSNTHRKTDGV